MNNNQFKFNLNNNPMPPNMLMQQGRTNSAYRFMIMLLVGVLPLLLCALFIMDPSMAGQFKQWGQDGVTNWNTEVSYGIMWLIGLGVYIAIFPTCVLLTKFSSDIKMDIIPGTSATGLIMLNMFVIPHSSAWFLLLSIPSFFIIGYVIGVIVIIFITLKKINNEIQKAQNNPEFQKMFNDLKGMQGMQGMGGPQNNQPGQNNKPDNKKLDQNPYVDVEDESEEE